MEILKQKGIQQQELLEHLTVERLQHVTINGEIIGDTNIAGICGNSCIYKGSGENNIIQYSYNTGTIQALLNSNSGNISGICGFSEGHTNVEKCYNKGNIINGNASIGGIVGRNLSRKYINGQISIQETAKSQVSYTCNIGSVNSNGVNIGGICGNNSQYCSVKDNYILRGLEVKKGSTNAIKLIGESNDYLGKIIGSAYSTSNNYIERNAEITNNTIAENGTEDITDTVYYIVNGYNEGESEYWAKDDVTHPSLKWEL